MTPVTDLAALEALYGAPVPASLTKVADHLTPLYTRWIAAARFVILSTVGAEGTDASPRGDAGPVVRIDGPHRLLLPDWQGNNRIDSLRNIVTDGRVSLMFMLPGESNVVRVNGTGIVTVDPDVVTSFSQKGKHPRSVIAVTVREVYFQCAKAIVRSGLWAGAQAADVPSAGDFLRERDAGFDGTDYDAHYAERSQAKMW